MNAWRRVCGPTRLVIPALRAMRRTIRPAAWRSRRSPSVPVKIGPFAAFTDGEVDGAGGAGRERDDHDLAAFAQDRQRAVAAFEAEGFDVGTGRFGDPETVERQKTDERVVAGAGESGGDEHRADLVAVQAGRVRLVVEAGSADVHGR